MEKISNPKIKKNQDINENILGQFGFPASLRFKRTSLWRAAMTESLIPGFYELKVDCEGLRDLPN